MFMRNLQRTFTGCFPKNYHALICIEKETLETFSFSYQSIPLIPELRVFHIKEKVLGTAPELCHYQINQVLSICLTTTYQKRDNFLFTGNSSQKHKVGIKLQENSSPINFGPLIAK